MARTSIAIQEVASQSNIAAVTLGAVDSVNGMMFPNDGQTILLVQNADAAPKTVTVASVADEAGRTGDQVITVAAGKIAIVGPLRQAWWNQRSSDAGNVYVDFSAATSTTVAALRLKQ